MNIRITFSILLMAAALSGCGNNAPSNTNMSSVGNPDKSSLPTPRPPGEDNRNANANNPQRNAVGESEATNTAGNAATNSR
jgi:hypothetical protein